MTSSLADHLQKVSERTALTESNVISRCAVSRQPPYAHASDPTLAESMTISRWRWLLSAPRLTLSLSLTSTQRDL